MVRTITVTALFLFLAACAGSPHQTGIEAQQNRASLLKLNVGLTKDQVLGVMGPPYKTEMYVIDGKPTEFWLYLTEGKSIHDLRVTDAHLTPLAFENGVLKGWGRNYYDTTLRIKKDVTIERK